MCDCCNALSMCQKRMGMESGVVCMVRPQNTATCCIYIYLSQLMTCMNFDIDQCRILARR